MNSSKLSHSVYIHFTNGFQFKILIELLKSMLKDIVIVSTKDKISMETVTDDGSVYITLDMNSLLTSKSNYICKKPINLGFTVKHLFDLIKSVKKQNNITLFVESESEMRLNVVVRQSKNTKNEIESYEINTMPLQMIDVISIEDKSDPNDYQLSFCIKSSDFQKSIKSLNTINTQNIRIRANKNKIMFTVESGTFMCKSVVYQTDSEEIPEELFTYDSKFSIQIMSNLNKIIGLGPEIIFYLKNESNESSPLLVQIPVIDIGMLTIGIKSL